jgi:diaminopimelate decarboxylase
MTGKLPDLQDATEVSGKFRINSLHNGKTAPWMWVTDLVAMFQSGADGYSASPLGFLGHPHPLEVLL